MDVILIFVAFVIVFIIALVVIFKAVAHRIKSPNDDLKEEILNLNKRVSDLENKKE